MTTLTKDPITGSFLLPNSPGTINLGSYPSSANPIGGSGFNLPSTPAPIAPPVRPAYVPPTLQQTQTQNNPTSSVYGLLLQILKDNQGKTSSQYTGNNTALLQGKENIGATNAGVYSQDMANANLTPAARLSLLGNDNSIQNPGLKSITDQMQMNEAHYNAANDALKNTETAYNNEQDRIQKAKEKAADMTFETPANISATESKMRSIAGPDGYIDPAVWVQMKSAWKAHGGSAASFISNFKDYVNPVSYDKVGLGTQADWVTQLLNAPGLQ